MGLWHDKCMGIISQMWVRFVVLYEIKGIMLMCWIAVFMVMWPGKPINCSQMGLIQAMACVGIYNCHGKWDRGDRFLFSVHLVCGNNTSWAKFIFAFIHYVVIIQDNLWLVLFIILGPRWKWRKMEMEPNAPRSYVKLGFCLLFWF